MQASGRRTDADKKRLGIYYTPSAVAETLVGWAIRSPTDTVLEPSFGGCNFLRASHSRLLQLACTDPLRQICGTDIDKHALDALGATFGMIDIQRRFLLKDFLSTDPSEFCVAQFDAVVGNPPYVSHHAMGSQQKDTAWTIAKKNGWPLRRTASLWAYFLLHSLAFCKPGARVAFVLPPQFLSADYAASVREILEKSFDETTFQPVAERMFTDQGTDERSILLLADGYHGRLSSVGQPLPKASGLKSSLSLEEASLKTFEALVSKSQPLGACADIRIGTVTGANKLFVLTPQIAEEQQFPDDILVPALAKIPKNHGLEYTEDDHLQAVMGGERCYLIQPPSKPLEKQIATVRQYFQEYSISAVAENRTFKKRPRWFVVDDVHEPHAFLSYMHHDGPTLLLNSMRAVCMNNIHRIWWKTHVSDRDQKLIAISFISTFTQLSAELEGRTYGGGVLKHEIKEARRIRVLIPPSLSTSSVDNAYYIINALLRSGLQKEAVAAADELLTAAYPEAQLGMRVPCLSAALRRLRNGRTSRA
ncbi:MAG TPA: N-6 DNA methylase [Thermoanaerobaculia bacterium]|jgi:adenine-specific DNA methylase